MGFEQRMLNNDMSHSSVDTYVYQTMISVTNSQDRVRMRNLNLRCLYWVSQATEVNTQYGSIGMVLMLYPDIVSSPVPDFTASGIDRQIKRIANVVAAGQNNPVLFSFSYRAINVNPGQKLVLATMAKEESSTNIVHHVVYQGQYWVSDD